MAVDGIASGIGSNGKVVLFSEAELDSHLRSIIPGKGLSAVPVVVQGQDKGIRLSGLLEG